MILTVGNGNVEVGVGGVLQQGYMWQSLQLGDYQASLDYRYRVPKKICVTVVDLCA